MKNTIIVGILVFFLSLTLYAKESQVIIRIEPIEFSQLDGIQSYAFAQYDGKWLIVGGRLDGLHQRQPFAAFGVAGNNNQLIVIDPVNKQKWVSSLNSLPVSIREQLSSTNMEFVQEGNNLYCVGGYGYSATLGDHTTYSKLTAIKVEETVEAIIDGRSISNYFRQIDDPMFQVTGGHLSKINDIFYLLGGQKFIGRYNPMGPSNGPGFIQEYTNAIRVFNINDDGNNITIEHLPSHKDNENLHRRDYNATEQIMPNGDEGITMFSGVFQESANLPFLNSVDVSSTGYEVNNEFNQYYNHYHCPVLPLYSESENKMHTIFFGGIAQFYDNNGTLVQDDNVPFVNTIARITRDKDGKMVEYKMPVEMPTLLGAGAEFIPNLNLETYDNGVFKLDELSEQETLVGYIYGGISSTAPNIFFTNDGTQSTANNQIFEVYLKIAGTTSVDEINESSLSSLGVKIYPNPNKRLINVEYNLTKEDNVKIRITDIEGKLIDEVDFINQNSGTHSYSKIIDGLVNGSIYFLSIETSNETETRKLVIER